jgi:hypothetical protein
MLRKKNPGPIVSEGLFKLIFHKLQDLSGHHGNRNAKEEPRGRSAHLLGIPSNLSKSLFADIENVHQSRVVRRTPAGLWAETIDKNDWSKRNERP